MLIHKSSFQEQAENHNSQFLILRNRRGSSRDFSSREIGRKIVLNHKGEKNGRICCSGANFISPVGGETFAMCEIEFSIEREI